MRKCSVLKCFSVKNYPKIYFFKVPKHSTIIWNEIISKINKQKTNVKLVCADDFLTTDLVINYY